MRLMRPRLLPATIAAMSALLILKSALLVQAAAGEAGAATPAPNTAEAAPKTKASTQAAPASPKLVAEPAPHEAAQPAPGVAVTEGEKAVLLALRKRRDDLDARARAQDQREAELAAANRRLEERVTELSALQSRLEGLEAGRLQHQAENWAGLVKTYEAMKPREAAAIFDVLDMQVLLQVLDRMQERKAAPVLAAMQPDRARLATQLLAELRTRAITPPEGPTSQPASLPLTPKG